MRKTLAGAFAGALVFAASVAHAQLSSSGVSVVTTYESAGLYWNNPGGTAGCQVRFRKTSDSTWRQGLDLWYDARNSQCRGSLVQLDPNTDYQAELNLPGQAASRAVSFRTWANTLPVASTVTVNSGSGTLNVTQGGSASGYKVYQGASGATLDAGNAAPNNVTINASYVIVRGLTLKGAAQDAIRISPNVTNVVIEDNDISGWGPHARRPLGHGHGFGHSRGVLDAFARARHHPAQPHPRPALSREQLVGRPPRGPAGDLVQLLRRQPRDPP
jgi:hypothetical protein